MAFENSASVAKNKHVRRKRQAPSMACFRSAVSNGSVLIEGIDGRSAWMRRLRDLIDDHTVDMANHVSEAEKRLIRRAAMLTLQLEMQESSAGSFQTPALDGHSEAWLMCGRRSGKSFILALALVAVFLAAFRDYRPRLGPGERATLGLAFGCDCRTTRSDPRGDTRREHFKGLLEIPMLAQVVEREGQECIDLANRVTIEVHTASFRSTRGYTIAAALVDELAFWPTDDAADPDLEVLAAASRAFPGGIESGGFPSPFS
jgi:hypothetical protein